MDSTNAADGRSDLAREGTSGRPRRKYTPRSSEDSTFVNSTLAISDSDESDTSAGESDDTAVPNKRKRKASSPPISSPPSDAQTQPSDREREPSRDVPGTQSSDLPSQPAKFPQSEPSPAEANETRRTVRPLTIYIDSTVINVPAGHVGPILLSVPVPPEAYSFPDLKAPPPTTQATPKVERPKWCTRVNPRKTTSTQLEKGKAGFLGLPSELRNQVYELLFVNDDDFHFHDPIGFHLPVVFLRTCHQVHEEARTVLYGANYFMFERRTEAHGSWFSPNWSEVGYKAVLEFLQMIGPVNTGLLRRIGLVLTDATPRLNPDLQTADSRRFVQDEVLLACLRHLAKNGKLHEIGLSFNGAFSYPSRFP